MHTYSLHLPSTPFSIEFPSRTKHYATPPPPPPTSHWRFQFDYADWQNWDTAVGFGCALIQDKVPTKIIPPTVKISQ